VINTELFLYLEQFLDHYLLELLSFRFLNAEILNFSQPKNLPLKCKI